MTQLGRLTTPSVIHWSFSLAFAASSLKLVPHYGLMLLIAAAQVHALHVSPCNYLTEHSSSLARSFLILIPSSIKQSLPGVISEFNKQSQYSIMRSLAKIFITNSRWSLTFLGSAECVEAFWRLTTPSICVTAENFGSGLCGHWG